MGGVVSPNPMELQYYNSSTHDDADGDTLLLLLLLSRCSLNEHPLLLHFTSELSTVKWSYGFLYPMQWANPSAKEMFPSILVFSLV